MATTDEHLPTAAVAATAQNPPTAPTASATPVTAPARAQSAGRGLLLITVAKLWFMVGGAAIGFLLPRVFPKDVGVARYGQWGTVLAWMSVLSNVIVTGTIQAVSRFSARGPTWVEGTKRAALRMNALVVGGIVLSMVLLAPTLAGFERDPGLVPLLRLSTGVLLCYGFYAVFVGSANGAREFQKQAGLDIGFTTLRALLVLGGAAVFASVQGAVAGFVGAAALILVASVAVVGWRPVQDRPALSELLAFFAPVAAYLLVQNALMFVDFWWLKRLLAEHAASLGVAVDEAAKQADRGVGQYNAALQIARLPYQAIIAVTFVVFPLVSQAEFSADTARTRGYIEKSLRLSLLVVAALATAVAARPDALLGLLFPKNQSGVNEYLQAAPALSLLMFAYVAFSLLSIAGTIQNGTGRARTALLVGALTLALDAVACRVAVGYALEHGHNPLAAAALASALSLFVGVALSLVQLQKAFGASLRASTIGRIAIAVVAGIVVGRIIPAPGTGLIAALVRLVAAGLGAAAYLATLFATRELTVAELRSLRRR